jgi:hypothetical protein
MGTANLERHRPTRSGVSNPADSHRKAERGADHGGRQRLPVRCEGTHESQGTPQAQGLSVPTSLAAVKTNGPRPRRSAYFVKPLYTARSSYPRITVHGYDNSRTSARCHGFERRESRPSVHRRNLHPADVPRSVGGRARTDHGPVVRRCHDRPRQRMSARAAHAGTHAGAPSGDHRPGARDAQAPPDGVPPGGAGDQGPESAGGGWFAPPDRVSGPSQRDTARAAASPRRPPRTSYRNAKGLIACTTSWDTARAGQHDRRRETPSPPSSNTPERAAGPGTGSTHGTRQTQAHRRETNRHTTVNAPSQHTSERTAGRGAAGVRRAR